MSSEIKSLPLPVLSCTCAKTSPPMTLSESENISRLLEAGLIILWPGAESLPRIASRLMELNLLKEPSGFLVGVLIPGESSINAVLLKIKYPAPETLLHFTIHRKEGKDILGLLRAGLLRETISTPLRVTPTQPVAAKVMGSIRR